MMTKINMLEKFLFGILLTAGTGAWAIKSAVPYDRYGRFDGVGSPQYQYLIDNEQALKKTLDPGIYPNTASNESQEEVSKKDLWKQSRVWVLEPAQCLKFWGSFDPGLSPLPQFGEGARQYYYAQCLERSGRLKEALKAYEAVVVHFPGNLMPVEPGKTILGSPYIGIRAMDALYALTRLNPQLGLRYVGGEIQVENGFDDQTQNDVLRVWPGRLLEVSLDKTLPGKAGASTAILKERRFNDGALRLVQLGNHHWQMQMNESPFLIRAVHYFPAPDFSRTVGWFERLAKSLEDPDETGPVQKNKGDFWKSGWSADRNKNGVSDINEAVLDINKNGRRDPGEPRMGDFAMMAMAGFNTVVLESLPEDDAILQKAHDEFGLWFIISESLGTDRSKPWAPWVRRVFYDDDSARQAELTRLLSLVRQYKNKDYLLAWSIGFSHRFVPEGYRSRKNKSAYVEFLKEAADLIRLEDARHPVIAVVEDLGGMAESAATLKSSVDVLGVSAYRMFHGFGDHFWMTARDLWDGPVMIFDFGIPAWFADGASVKAQEYQLLAHKRYWSDIAAQAANASGYGRALGGAIFEWSDSWWRHDWRDHQSALTHNEESRFSGPAADGLEYPEWYGLMSLPETSEQGELLRQPRPVYFYYSKLWKK